MGSAYETVAVQANGKTFTGWKTFWLKAALNVVARECRLTVSEVPQPGHEDMFDDSNFFAEWHFPPYTPINVAASGTQLLDGYVDEYNPSGDKRRHDVILTVGGKGMDFDDTSVVHPTGQFTNQKVEAIAKQLDVCQVGISTDVDTGAPIPRFSVRQGASPSSEILRLCQQRKLVAKGKADGSVVLTRAGTQRHAGGLFQGLNCESLSAALAARERFSDYLAIGQGGDLYDEPQPQGRAADKAVPRYRPKKFIDQAATNNTLARQRAEWEKARAAGNSSRATIVTPSWRDSSKVIWEPGWLVFVKAPWLKLSQDMLIESVEFEQNTQTGTTARLELVDPQTYAGDASAQSNSSPMWDQ